MIKVGIIGAAGYTGSELIRLLMTHPDVKITALVGNSNAGQNILAINPYLQGFVDLMVDKLDIEDFAGKVDVAFLALPHSHALNIAGELLERNVKVIDLGADFRFHDTQIYEQWYHLEHNQTELAKEAVYAIPEIWRDEIKGARLIANPGCYPTSVQIAMYPLLKAGLADLSRPVVVDSKSGITGAGRNAAKNYLYCETAESINPYGIAEHRHTPEIEQGLSRMSSENANVIFTPHLTPMSRGILSTIYVSLKEEISTEDLWDMYQEAFAGEYFVRLLPLGIYPHTKWVSGSNFCDVNVKVDPRTNMVVLTSAIDNIVKGAAGQAIQNMNIIFGLAENKGLEICPVFP